MHVSSIKPLATRKVNLTYSTMLQVSALAIIYTVLIFTLPASRITMNAYHFSPLEYRIIDYAVALPSILVWFAAFGGFSTLQKYAEALDGSPEGTHFSLLAKGCGWLAWSLPVTSIISIILSTSSYTFPGFHPTAIIITNYINLLVPLIAFSIIGNASRGLVSSSKLRIDLTGARRLMLLFLSLAAVYCFLTFSHFSPHSIGSTKNPFFLPIWVMLFTVIVPYLYVWFVGLMASYEITIYSKQITGMLYRHALSYLVAGLVTIIVSSIALQYVNGVVPRVGHLLLNYKLVMTVLFHLFNGLGFIILAYGAHRLKKIEEI